MSGILRGFESFLWSASVAHTSYFPSSGWLHTVLLLVLVILWNARALGTTDCPLTNKYPLLGILQGVQVCHTIPSLHASTSSCLQNQYTLKLRSVCQHKVQPWPLLEYNFWYLQGNRRFYISDAYLCLYIFYFNVYFICTGVLPACVCTTFMPNAVQGSRCL